MIYLSLQFNQSCLVQYTDDRLFCNFRFSIVYMIFYLLGLGSLAPWNFFITASEVNMIGIYSLTKFCQREWCWSRFVSSINKRNCDSLKNNKQKFLSHLSAHVINRLLHENRKSIPKIFNGKKTSKKCNPPDFKFYVRKLNNKIFSPYSAMLILCLFSLH